MKTWDKGRYAGHQLLEEITQLLFLFSVAKVRLFQDHL